MSVFAVILLILLGFLLLLIEFAIIPGITVAGIGGFALLAFSVYIAFTQYGTTAGFIVLAIVLIGAPIMIYYFFKSRTGKKMILESQLDGKVTNYNSILKVGDEGITIGRLAPSGKVKINNEIFEGRSIGTFIDHNTKIKIKRIESYNVIVEPIK